MDERKQTITEAMIRRRVGERSFERGQHYFHAGRIVNARRAGAMLKADCHGSYDNLYRVRATIEEGAIADADCSCPVGSGGHCKHVAALLLTWLKRPEDFREVEEVDAALSRRSKDELVALIRQMLLRAPELESLLEVPLPTGKRTGQKVNPETYRRQVAAAFRGYDDEGGDTTQIAEKISATVAIADGFLAQGEADNAAAIYQATLNEVLARYSEFDDESGDLSQVVGDCVEGLGRCLEDETADTARREQILRALFEVYAFDVNLGGVGLGDDVPDLLLRHTNDAEKPRVSAWTLAAMKKQSKEDWSDHWHRQVYGGFLLRLQAHQLDDEGYLRLCRESHRLNDLVERLLSLGRVEEAIEEAQRASDYEALELADIFVRHKHADAAERMMFARAKTTQDTRVWDWLTKQQKARGDPATALVWARRVFDVRPSPEQYREIQSLAQRTHTWESVRAELLADLNKKKHFDLLIEIFLLEKDIDAALATLEQTPSDSPFGYADLALPVAKAAEASRPRDALRIYQQAAEQIIAARARGAYAEACEHLARVRQLYRKLDEGHAWEEYRQKIDAETKSLRAFKEEMARAKL